ncbi:LOW QUALITY PROTEIN: small ribosomal subunit protein mS40 [Lepisosteus oculatus]|uniref:LOW QUALITY PROTEIN: small ribosomal subunit protein mS40 n=1 Tax=Lepisosteus oculatus TaxID=7918 RepID=UPI0035F524E3
MAASLSGMLRGLVQRATPVVLRGLRDAQLVPRPGQRGLALRRFASTAAPREPAPAGGAGETTQAEAFDSLARYRERPWEYLDSEEYVERYGQREVWTDYRRNHKGGIPPQKTRKTCIRGDKISGNPCPICRDPKLVVHYQNVKLLQQFLSPHTGEVYDSTRTGVCMRQQKSLTRAIDTAREHGLLPVQVPLADFEGKDFSNRHGAVAPGRPPPPPGRAAGEPWYSWYRPPRPDPRDLARVQRVYRKYLRPAQEGPAGE